MKWYGYIAIGVIGAAVFKRKEILDYALTQQQEPYINELHPLAQNKFKQLISEFNALGYNVIVTGGYRSFARSAELKEENPDNATPGYSYHNYGFSLDINLVNIQTGTWIQKASSKSTWVNAGAQKVAKKLGLRWGGDFQSYYDPVHFDFPLIDSTKLLALAQLQYGKDPKYILGNKVKITI